MSFSVCMASFPQFLRFGQSADARACVKSLEQHHHPSFFSFSTGSLLSLCFVDKAFPPLFAVHSTLLWNFLNGGLNPFFIFLFQSTSFRSPDRLYPLSLLLLFRMQILLSSSYHATSNFVPLRPKSLIFAQDNTPLKIC
jgi:hypothetical protein